MYVLDKLTVVMRVRYDTISHILGVLCDGSSASTGEIAKQCIGRSPGSMHYNYTIALQSGHSYYLGFGVTGTAPNSFTETVKVEFNPAKVGNDAQFTYVYEWLLSGCRYLDFGRFDVAIDIPVARDKFILVKDKRKYAQLCNSNLDKTEYLGLRSQHGNVKLYNKGLESKLGYDLTRLEITMDYKCCSFAEFSRVFPDVLYFDSAEIPEDVTGTNKVLLIACMEHPELLKEITRDKRKKIRQLLGEAAVKVNASELDYKIILQQILDYGKGLPAINFTELEQELDIDFGEDFEEIRGYQTSL